MINSFKGKYSFLSNFYICTVEYEGITYKSSEAAFQATKSSDPLVRATFSSLSPSEAKAKGRKVKLRPDWETIKNEAMFSILYAKFRGNPELEKQLLELVSEEFEEQNTWHDNYWGNCICPRCSRKEGLNHLGKILKMVQEFIIEENEYLNPKNGDFYQILRKLQI